MSYPPQGPAPQGPGPQANPPSKGLSIAGLVLSILGCTWVIGLVLSIIAFVKARGQGRKDNIALAGIIIGAIWALIGIIGVASGGFTTFQQCQKLGSGTHQVGNVTLTCP